MLKISIIIPVYNTERWIGNCLDSVLNQQGVDIECIVVDDCGSDAAMQIVAHYTDSRVVVLHHTHNRGLSAARNTGTAAATGDWVFYLDSDDSLPNGSLSAMALYAAEGVDWVQGTFRRKDNDREWLTTYSDARYETRSQVVAAYKSLNFTNATNKLINSRLAHKLSFCEGLIFEDSLWCAHAYQLVSNIVSISTPTYNHNVRQGSIMQTNFSKRKIESLLYIVQQMAAMSPDINQQQAITFNTIYMIKNLYVSNFSYGYRRSVMRRLDTTDVALMSIDRSSLQPLSRLLSYGFRLPHFYFYIVCRLYRLIKRRA